MAAVSGMAGLVLAGGRSSRFGQDKASQRLAGRPLLAWSLAALDPVSGAVAVSADPESEAGLLATALGRTVLPDDPRHARGPLTGLAAGLTWARARGFPLLATLPCDTPLAGAQTMAVLVAALGDAPAAYAVTPEGPQALCAVWRPSLLPDLAARLAAGDHPAAHAWLAGIGARAVAFEDAGPFANVNRAEDLRRLEAALAAGR
jgi:molybdopterin-guanine dinucleotide biosynthesis protein A